MGAAKRFGKKCLEVTSVPQFPDPISIGGHKTSRKSEPLHTVDMAKVDGAAGLIPNAANRSRLGKAQASPIADSNEVIRRRDGDAQVPERVSRLDGSILLSIISTAELEAGVYRDPSQVGVRRPRLDARLRALPVLTFDYAAADAYRLIVEAVGYSRRKLLDRRIAAQALVHQATLVTQNSADFQDVAGLNILTW